MDYDHCWHPEVAEFAVAFADPASMPEIRREAQRLYDHWETRQAAYAAYQKRLDAWRAYERFPECRNDMKPLQIDRNIVEMAALLLHVRPQTRSWFQEFHDELVVIASRTKPLRLAILAAESRPPIDLDSNLGIAC